MSSIFDQLNHFAAKENKAHLISFHPSGSMLVWVTPDEPDVMGTMLQAAVRLMTMRGTTGAGVTIRKMEILTQRGEFYWSLMSQDGGSLLAEGYAATREEAETATVAALKEHRPQG